MRPCSSAPAPQLRERDGVEGARGDRLATPRRPSRVRSSPAALRVNVTASTCARVDHALARLPRDAAGEHPRLARARAREDRQRRGAAGDRVALRRVETVEERVHRGTVPPGCDTDGDPRPDGSGPEQQKAPSSLRCVAARISSGPFLPTSSDPSPQGCPRCSASVSASGSLASRGWSRSARSPHRIPLRSVFRVFPSVPLVPPDLRRLARASRPFLPGTGPVFTGPRNIPTARARMQEEISLRAADTFRTRGRSVALGVRTDGRRRARRDPRRARDASSRTSR